MLSTSVKILWALLFVELYIHNGIHAGDVKIGKISFILFLFLVLKMI